MDGGTAALEDLVADRLARSSLPEQVSGMVLAALLGDDELAGAVDGDALTQRTPPAQEASAAPAAYLLSVRVAGFRGIGKATTLELKPGPGLTVVTGRNGSGKSSFAEAIEFALTGDNKRWSGRTAVWRNSWRNLHAGDTAGIVVELVVDGQSGPTRVSRQWNAGAALADDTSYAQPAGQPRRPVDALGWTRALQVHRPFLSYAELGGLVEGKQTEMYDAVQSILGLDQLVDAEARLVAVRKELDDQVKQARVALPELRERLAAHPDPRAAEAAEALSGAWDLDLAERVAAGSEAVEPAGVAILRARSQLALPTPRLVESALAGVTTAARRLAALADSPAAEARRLAALLSAALEHQAGHPGQPCPVCAGRPLDDDWAATASAEVARLTATAEAADEAHGEYDRALQDVRALAFPIPDALPPGPARTAWQGWLDIVIGPAAELDRAVEAYDRLSRAVETVQEQAATQLRQLDDAWRPLATELAAWIATARRSVAAAATATTVKAALNWLRTAGQDIRNDRLEPFAAISARVWERLRQESNVELGPIRLAGAATQRRVTLDVTVDGVKDAALGVMSQGELHALGLALFLPRATTVDSPFRFLVIDDPVQSMDPAKVDGLARVLHEIAASRQVVVFTHDDRLTESLRRLQLDATVWAVVRRENSVVELRRVTDPVAIYLDDARALARTTQLSEDARAVVVAGLCRGAIEAACHEVVRRRRLAKGVPHIEVERALTDAHTIYQQAALAMFDDPGRGGDVLPRLSSKYGPSFGNAFAAARDGSHGAYGGALPDLVRDVTRLTEKLRA
jgi:recombinational DNA repair ATPase RecF